MPPPSPVSSLTTRFSSPCGAHTCLLSLLLASVLNVISPEDHLSLTYFSEFYLSCFYDTTFSRKLPLSEKIALVRAPRHLVLPSIINTVMSVDLSTSPATHCMLPESTGYILYWFCLSCHWEYTGSINYYMNSETVPGIKLVCLSLFL